MISAIIQNLNRGVSLLSYINDDEYSNNSTAPYYSSIGIHMRHILDVFSCIFDGLESRQIDLTARQRNELAENKVRVGLSYFDTVIAKLKEVEVEDLDLVVEVKDDLGLGLVTANYTLAAALIQAHSHAIHHYAIINYILNRLDITIMDESFGYNPTTPKPEANFN